MSMNQEIGNYETLEKIYGMTPEEVKNMAVLIARYQKYSEEKIKALEASNQYFKKAIKSSEPVLDAWRALRGKGEDRIPFGHHAVLVARLWTALEEWEAGM